VNKIEKYDQYRQTSETTERFCFVISTAGLNRHNTGKDDDNKNTVN
jgi:hypothetical protein